MRRRQNNHASVTARMVVAGLLLLCGMLPAPAYVTRTLTVHGVERSARVYPGKDATTTPAPLVLAFHGFGSDPGNMSRMSRLHEAWPEATVVYPLGLKVMSKRWKRMAPAWQAAPDRDHNRDVYFIDALLDDLATTYKVDLQRVYVTGSSNGALFSYVLLTMRRERFAAFAPVAGACRFVKDAKTPKPLLLIHGEKDTTVKIEDARGTRDLLRALNGCGTDTVEWAPGYLSYQPCTSGQPVIWHEHGGGHLWPSDASAHIIRFFKEHALPLQDAPPAQETTVVLFSGQWPLFDFGQGWDVLLGGWFVQG